MSEQRDTAAATPEWDVADRMRKALRHADMSVGAMAEYLDVRRETVSTWINGRIEPSTQTLRLWALACGVPLEWLRDGTVPSQGGGGGGLFGSAPALGLEPRTCRLTAVAGQDEIDDELEAA